MKKNFLIIFITVLGLTTRLCNFSYSQPCYGVYPTITMSTYCDDNSPWILRFEDNFDGNQLDLSKWELQIHSQGLLNNESSQGYYSLDNIEIANGYLNIIAKKETVIRRTINYCPHYCICDDETDDGTSFDDDIDNCILSDGLPNLRTFNYTSSNIWTKEKFFYGKFEISCKIPEGSFWPAFWLYGDWNLLGEYDRWNEIDVFEFRKGNNKPASNVHYDIDGDGDSESCSESPVLSIIFSETFNTFTLIWDEYKIEWYINGNLIRQLNKYYSPNTSLLPLECSDIREYDLYFRTLVYGYNPMQLILNLAVEKGADTPNDSDLPANFIIDYVRIWQKEERSCCLSHKLYEATENLPSITSVEGYIKAGFDAGITDISGDVIVRNGQFVSFNAGEFIDLSSGFDVEAGATFTAEITPCTLLQGDNIVINTIPDSFSPDNDGIDEKLFISVNGATHYSVFIENKIYPYSRFYLAYEMPIYSNPIAVWDGSCNYIDNCWFYHKCNRQRRVKLHFFNCENALISEKIIDVNCDSKSLQNEDGFSMNQSSEREVLSEADNSIMHFTIHPNPFSDSFTISFSQPEETDAKIYLTDAYGRQVQGIFSGSIDKGQHSIDVSTDGITKGLYFCIMETKSDRKVVKIVKTE